MSKRMQVLDPETAEDVLIQKAKSDSQMDANRYRSATRKAEATSKVSKFFMWVVMVIGAIAFMTPFYVMIVMALKTPGEIATTSAWAWPKDLTFENFKLVLENPNAVFSVFFQNTLVITILSTLGVLVSSSLVAYPFARMKFRGRDRLFLVLLATMMLPGIVTMIPTYLVFKYLHWVDTFLPLWVPAWFGGGAFNIFLLRQFFKGIPMELDEAAVLDGASHSTIFWRIILPLSGPALATVGIFSFIYVWRDFQGPLLYLNSPEKQTLELGLQTYRSLNNEQWNLLMAAATLVTIPLIVLFLLGQRWFVRGIVMTGGK